jgi:6-pyruvoyltetrahydropterin/6-carboxytetrahydropterin synthase
MYEVSVEAAFSAIHSVLLPSGEPEPVHGHDWEVVATFAGPRLDKAGMLVDFTVVEACLGQIVRQLHHADLNVAPVMRGLAPTAENVARVIYEHLAGEPRLAALLDSVAVKEAPGCRARYFGTAVQTRPPRPV